MTTTLLLYLKVIHEHWGTFPPQPFLVNHIVGFCYIFLFLINIIGNGSVVYIFLKVESLRTASNIFVINLAISDMCMITSQALPVILNVFKQRYWMWGVLLSFIARRKACKSVCLCVCNLKRVNQCMLCDDDIV